MSRSESPQSSRWRHRFAAFLSCCVVLLIAAGALVTSKEAGLSVPDWPLSYGGLNPPRWWEIENVRAEHGHRLIAGTVALMTIGLAVWFGRREGRRWVRRIAYLAVVAVLAQAGLGGLTVLFFLPTPISVGHAALAQIFLCLVVTLAVTTSAIWRDAGRRALPERGGGRELARLATTSSALIYVQILLGAVMRHSGAGLAIPDFPLAFGRLIPPQLDFPIAIHFSHRLGAVVVTCAVLWTVARALRSAGGRLSLALPASAMGLLVALQVTLGAYVVWTAKAVVPNTAHVATGATLLAASVVLSLFSWRWAHAAEAVERADPGTELGAAELTGGAVS